MKVEVELQELEAEVTRRLASRVNEIVDPFRSELAQLRAFYREVLRMQGGNAERSHLFVATKAEREWLEARLSEYQTKVGQAVTVPAVVLN